MPQSITSILNQPVRYQAGNNDCQCTEDIQCLLATANQNIYSQLRISPCGDFEVCNNSLDAELICNGGFDLGAELVTNGTFTGSATGWTVPANWSYNSNNVCGIAVAAGQTLLQSIPSIVAGEYYYVVYTVTNYSAGDVRVTLGGADGATRSANGTYAELIQVVAGTDISFNRVTGNFTGCIDNVSVKLLECWIPFGGLSTWSGGAMCADGTNGTFLQQLGLTVVNGQAYQVSYEVSNRTTGEVQCLFALTSGTVNSANGVFTETIIAGAVGAIDFVSTNNFDGCIDNVSVKHIDNCWDTDGTDWIASADGACHETGNTTDLTNTGTPVVSGKYYHVTITVSSSTAGGVNIVIGTTVLTPQTSGNGVFDFWGEANGTTLKGMFL